MGPTSAIFVSVPGPCPASWLNGTGHLPSLSGHGTWMCAREYMHSVCGWMGASCSASGMATQSQLLSVNDLLVLLVAADYLATPGSAVLI